MKISEYFVNRPITFKEICEIKIFKKMMNLYSIIFEDFKEIQSKFDIDNSIILVQYHTDISDFDIVKNKYMFSDFRKELYKHQLASYTHFLNDDIWYIIEIFKNLSIKKELDIFDCLQVKNTINEIKKLNHVSNNNDISKILKELEYLCN